MDELIQTYYELVYMTEHPIFQAVSLLTRGVVLYYIVLAATVYLNPLGIGVIVLALCSASIPLTKLFLEAIIQTYTYRQQAQAQREKESHESNEVPSL